MSSTLPHMAIEAVGLQKVYGKGENAKTALDGIDLSVPRGSLFALLGPNGAGKSTFINILAGSVVKTGGSARIWDYDIDQEHRRARAAIGIVPQEINIDPFFTPYEVLEFQAGLYGVPKSERQTEEILHRMQLSDKAQTYSRQLSGGMRRRLLVAKSLVHRPPVLILDEPTAGVDVDLRRQLWDYIRELNCDGVTVVLTTHYLEEAEELCDHVAIINHGEIVAAGDKADLMARFASRSLTFVPNAPVRELPPELIEMDLRLQDGCPTLIQYGAHLPVTKIVAALAAAGIEIVDVKVNETDLEAVFLQLTNADQAAE